MNLTRQAAVIGESWAAYLAVHRFLEQGFSVQWISGTGARILPPLPFVEAGKTINQIQKIAESLGIETGEIQEGAFLREFKNKAFQVSDLALEDLWQPESRFFCQNPARFSAVDFVDLEEKIREALIKNPALKRVEGVPVQEISPLDEGGFDLTLGSGEIYRFESVVYADRWSELREIDGIKWGGFVNKLHPVGVLQMVLTHREPVMAGVREGLTALTHKEAGEKFDRRVWGYLSEDGLKSYWTFFLTSFESEDNHEIVKKLRRIKQTLGRMLSAPDFLSNIKSEHVRFEENMVFSEGSADLAPQEKSGVILATDGFGVFAGADASPSKTHELHSHPAV